MHCIIVIKITLHQILIQCSGSSIIRDWHSGNISLHPRIFSPCLGRTKLVGGCTQNHCANHNMNISGLVGNSSGGYYSHLTHSNPRPSALFFLHNMCRKCKADVLPLNYEPVNKTKLVRFRHPYKTSKMF